MKFNLIKHLENHKSFDKQEKENTEKSIIFLKEHGKYAFERDYTPGHFTASCYLFNKDYTKLLMTHHKQFDAWYQLGGHCEGDSNTYRVAKKEAWEESGIKKIKPISRKIADVDIQFIESYGPDNMPGHYHYDIRYFFKTNTTDYIVSDESYDLKWVDLKEFKEISQLEEAKRVALKWELLLKEKSSREKLVNRKKQLKKEA